MPKPELYVSRSDLGWGACPAAYADPKSGLVIHYDSSNQNLANRDHSACIAYWQWCRKFHMNGNRWVCIGYSFMACPHSYILEGRGLFRAQAAQPGGNTTYYSVTLATGPTDIVTPGQINAVRQLREWLMEPKSSIAGTVKGHRDFIATSCPGDKAYRMVRDGTFKKPAVWGGTVLSVSTDPTPKEDDVPHYLNMAHTSRVEIPPGEYVSLRWDTVWTDTANTAHEGGLAVMTKTGDVNGALWLGLDGLETGREVQVRMVDYVRATKKYQLHPIAEGVGTAGKEFPAIPVVNRLAGGRTMDLRVYNVGDQPITLNRATFKGHVWLR